MRALLLVLLSAACVRDPAEAIDAAPEPPDAMPPPTHPGEVWMATWNIEQFPKTPETIATVVQLIRELDPDLVGVEEIADVAAWGQLLAQLPEYHGELAYDPTDYIRVGLLAKKNSITLSNVETLFTTDSYAFPRPVLKAHVVSAAGGFDFDLLVVHLKALGDADSLARRRDATTKLAAWIDTQTAAGPETDFVIVGDWNDELTDAVEWNAFQPFLTRPDDFQFLDLPLEQAGDATYIPFSSMIDHILVTTDALGEYGAGDTTVVRLDQRISGYQTTVSDHRPVLARFRP